MRHIWQNELRHGAHEIEREVADDDVADSGRDNPEVLLTRKLLRSEIVHAVDSLPARFREVVVLREIEELSYAEIARVLNCPRGTVMSRLSRARQLLRRLLADFAPSSWEVER